MIEGMLLSIHTPSSPLCADYGEGMCRQIELYVSFSTLTPLVSLSLIFLRRAFNLPLALCPNLIVQADCIQSLC